MALAPIAPVAAATTETTGCRSVSADYPWGKAALRTWTPRYVTAPTPYYPIQSMGAPLGQPFQARLVYAFGEAHLPAYDQAVELETADGCRRRFRVSGFSDANVSDIQAEIAAHVTPRDTATYRTDYQTGRGTEAAITAGVLGKYETQHFTFWYGTDRNGDSYKYVTDIVKSDFDSFIRSAGVWAETQWYLQRDVNRAPMPFANATDKKKVAIYVCGTGLPFVASPDLKDCGASTGDAMFMGTRSIGPGDPTVKHEFGHIIEYNTGGLQLKAEAGPVWETIAEWSAFNTSPNFASFVPLYFNNLENGPLWSTPRYGQSPFSLFLFEQDRTRPLFWSAWTNNLRSANGGSTEDYLQSYVRQGQAAGIWPNGFASFADDMGWYGARLAAYDFKDRLVFSTMNETVANIRLAAYRITPLATTARANEYTSTPARPLLQFGTHIIPLTPTGGEIDVTVAGSTRANEAAWRFVIVAVQDDGTTTYSSLGAVKGDASATIGRAVPAGAKVYLAVTATPGTYESLGWQDEKIAPSGTKFPYRVVVTGATPATFDAVDCTKYGDLSVNGPNDNIARNPLAPAGCPRK